MDIYLSTLTVLGAMLSVSGWMLAVFLAIQYQILTRITDQRIMSAVLADRIERQTNDQFRPRGGVVQYAPAPPPVMLPSHTQTALPVWDRDAASDVHRPRLPVAPVKVPLTQARIDDTEVTESMPMGRATNNRTPPEPYDTAVTQRPANDMEWDSHSEDAVVEMTVTATKKHERTSTKSVISMPKPSWWKER